MTSTLLIAATTAEIAPLLQVYKLMDMAAGRVVQLPGTALNLLVTGAGMVNTAQYVAMALQAHPYSVAIQAGIAGTFSERIPVGSVFQVTADSFADFGADNRGDWLSAAEIGLLPDEEPYLIQGTVKPLPLPATHRCQLPSATSVTVQTASGEAQRIQTLQHRFDAELESMEGAACMLVCARFGVPCLQLRAVSNFIEPRDKNNWNIPIAVENLHHSLTQFLSACQLI